MSIKVKFLVDFHGHATDNVRYTAGDEADLAVWQVELLLPEGAVEVLKIEPEDEAKLEQTHVSEADGKVVVPAHKRKKAK